MYIMTWNFCYRPSLNQITLRIGAPFRKGSGEIYSVLEIYRFGQRLFIGVKPTSEIREAVASITAIINTSKASHI